MSQHTSPAIERLQQAFAAYLKDHPHQTITVQLPGMEASTLRTGHEAAPSVVLADLQDLAQGLQAHWEEVLVSVRNGELTHLVIEVPGQQNTSLKIVPTNQDS
ncbi:hypothetical protein [Deinococcus misasensis]|uniref:hypothetical protein n=1 Tax=Deinococcus misasensis TaxID=392413 RepID=UPI000555D4AF|nr:hypothetical protein [Deinococcus misasensis]